MIDFAKLKADAKAKEKNPTLMLLLAAPQGGGKSYTSGTFGLPTLYCHGSAEAHGPAQAEVPGGSNIVAYNWDEDAKDANQAYSNLLKVLADPTIKDHFGAVVIDGASDLTFGLLRDTKAFSTLCLTTKGEHNTWEESKATLQLLKPIMKSLQRLKRDYVHTVMTMILDVQSVDSTGGLSIVKPVLPTKDITVSLVPQFDDICMVSEITDHPDLEKPQHLLQFCTTMKRVSKDKNKNVTSIFHITPRITGVDKPDMPEYYAADLGKLAAFKKEKMGLKNDK